MEDNSEAHLESLPWGGGRGGKGKADTKTCEQDVATLQVGPQFGRDEQENGFTEQTPLKDPMPGTMSLEGGEGALLETFIQGVAMPRLDIQGQELYLEDATLSSATPVF